MQIIRFLKTVTPFLRLFNTKKGGDFGQLKNYFIGCTFSAILMSSLSLKNADTEKAEFCSSIHAIELESVILS